MNFKLGKLLCVAFCAFMLGIVLAVNAFGETVNSNIFTAEVKNSFDGIDLRSISTTANFNWETENGEKINKSTMANLPSYLLTVNASGESRKKVKFISTPKEAVDMSRCGRIYFAVQYSADEDDHEYIMNFELGNGEDSLFSSVTLSGTARYLVSFEVGFFARCRDITSLSLEFVSDTDVDGKISVSGPYYIKSDDTYAEKFCLVDASLSNEAQTTHMGIVISDSTQKTGFSGRFQSPSRSRVNYLRLLISTGSVGGTMEMRYSYLNEETGNLTTKAYSVALESSADNFTYIVPLEYADRMISLSFLFDVAREGDITVHSIEAVELYDSDKSDIHGEISRCDFISGEGTVKIKGKIFHDFLIKHTRYTLNCYRLSTAETVSDVISSGAKPVASAKMSSEFQITYKAGRQDKLAAVSRYAIVATDGEEYIEILPPFHVDGNQSKTSKDSSDIKGICTPNAFHVTGSGVGVSVVDVYLDLLTNKRKSGFLYSIGDTHVYFDSEYVEEIDKKIKNLCASGCSVYIRLLINADREDVFLPYAADTESGAVYSAIEVKTEEAKLHLFAVIDFLTTRYSSHADSEIDGYIMGRSVNIPDKYNGSTDSALVSYSDSLASAMEIIALSASVTLKDIKMIVPVSVDAESAEGYDPELFLTSLCNRLDEPGGLDFTVMLESRDLYVSAEGTSLSSSPYIFDEAGRLIPNNELVIVSSENTQSIEFSTHISELEKMLARLAKHSSSAPDRYIYFWEPAASESDENVLIAYIYMYYSFVFSNQSESFILSLENTDDPMLIQLVKYIDTARNQNGELVSFLPEVFGAMSWIEIMPDFNGANLIYRIFSEAGNSDNVSPSGKYVLFDFSTSFGVLDWFEGDGCQGLSLVSEAGEKFLCAVMDENSEHSEIAYCFDYPEKLDIAPYLNFEFSVGSDVSEKYSVKITVRSGKNVIEAEDIFSGGKKCGFTVDISKIASKADIDSVRICVRSLGEEEGSYDFKLLRVSALSKTLSDEQLSRAISQSRAEAKNPAVGNELENPSNTPDYEFAFILVAVLVIFVVVAGIYDRNKE